MVGTAAAAAAMLSAVTCHLALQPIRACPSSQANHLALSDRRHLSQGDHWMLGSVRGVPCPCVPLQPVCVFLLFTLCIGSDSAVSMHELWIKGKCLLVLMGFCFNVVAFVNLLGIVEQSLPARQFFGCLVAEGPYLYM